MAIYHLSVKSISRSAGRSVVAAAAYRAGQELTDERQGLTHDYTRKQGVEGAFIVAPDGAGWAQDRNALWNAAEAAEKRKDAKTGREYELALPAELDAGARKELARDFARELVARYGVVADVAIHEPGREGDNRNHHAHILTTTRTAGEDGLGAKTRVLDVASTASAEIEHMRGVWARQVNMALERHQVEQRVDHRSFARQGKEQEPTRHM
ncbi:MobQ family relaxase, partial [Acetobacter oeni]